MLRELYRREPMECQSSDSKKVFKDFDASKRKHTRKKRDGFDDSVSLATDDSVNGCQRNGHRINSAKGSLQNISADIATGAKPEVNSSKRDHDSSPSMSPVGRRRSSHSPRRHRHVTRDGISLALKAGLVSTPRSVSPPQNGGAVVEPIPQDQDSFIYALLEEAVKRDKRKHRHARRREERRGSAEREAALRPRRRRDRPSSKDRDRDTRYTKDGSHPPAVDQAALLETFAKLCVQLNEKSAPHVDQVARAQSHKSLQCEVTRRDSYNVANRPERLHSRQVSRDNMSPSRIRSHDNFRSREADVVAPYTQLDNRKSQCICHSRYIKETPKFDSKLNVENRRMRAPDKYHDYPRDQTPTRSCVNQDYYRPHVPDTREYRDYEERREPARDRIYDDKRGYCEQTTSRSYDVHREGYDERIHRAVRSDNNREKFYPEVRDYKYRKYNELTRPKYYDNKPPRDPNFVLPGKEHSRRNLERLDRNSIASREDDYRERYSERERDSGLSVADGETSTISGRSNCLRAVKQEISEQREAMDKMMKLWKELMRCFKGISQTQGQDRNVQESAANARDSAAAQLRLWRECMHRYETVARDVGDTDARLMEEINKQRSEMSEMANMWQECLQRYRDMSNDFNSLKQQLARGESPPRAAAPPAAYAEGEGAAPAACRLPHAYPPMPLPHMAPEYPRGVSPLRPRASAPPAWWWAADEAQRSPRRRSSPESRGSRDRRHRHRDRERDTRYKEKAKPSGARSEHRHRKR